MKFSRQYLTTALIVLIAGALLGISIWLGEKFEGDEIFKNRLITLDAIGSFLSGVGLLILLSEFIDKKNKEVSLREKEVLNFFQNNLPNIKVTELYSETNQNEHGDWLNQCHNCKKRILFLLQNFSKNTAFRVRVDISRESNFSADIISDYADEFVEGQFIQITREDFVNPDTLEPHRVELEGIDNYYTQDTQKQSAFISYVRLSFSASSMEDDKRIEKIYKLFIDKVDDKMFVKRTLLMSEKNSYTEAIS